MYNIATVVRYASLLGIVWRATRTPLTFWEIETERPNESRHEGGESGEPETVQYHQQIMKNIVRQCGAHEVDASGFKVTTPYEQS